LPWPKDHKTRTRKRIVQAAAAAFRARGISGVAVEDVMRDAGLTHGGFYAHFGSKDELVGEALDLANAETVALLENAGESMASRQGLHALIDEYLSDWHAAHPERGCPLAALGPEVARGGSRGRRRLVSGVTERLGWMKQMSRSRGTSADSPVVPLLACLVGGLILARAAGRDKAPAILKSCREFLHQAIDGNQTRGH